MLPRTVCLVVLFVASIQSPSKAHHSYRTDYLEDEWTSIEGDLAEFRYRNPHSVLLVDIPSTRHRVRQYRVEWSNPGTLRERGITRDTLRRGDRVVIGGSPGRVPGEARLHLKRIERRSDGWKWAARAAHPSRE